MEEKKQEIKEEEQKTEPANTNQKPEIAARSMILWALGGVYLLYTGYRLCKNVLDGVDGSSWGFFAAGAFFIVVGIVLICMSIKSYNDKIKREQEALETPEQSVSEEENASEEEQTEENLAAEHAESDEITESAEIPEKNVEINSEDASEEMM